MYCKVESEDILDIEPTNILQQTSFWAKVKHNQGLMPKAFRIEASPDLLSPITRQNKKIQDDILILIKQISQSYSFAYVPYGPEVEPDFENYGVFLEELSEVIRPHLPANCIFIRYDLPWENQWSKEDDYRDDNGNWIGPPPLNVQEFRVNFNTNNWNLVKSPSDNLPTSTFFLNLRYDEDILLKRMKPKTRYNIKLSSRKGVTVSEHGLDKLDIWYDLYTETAHRNGVTLHSKEYFSTVLKNQQVSTDNLKISLLMGESDNEYLSAMFLILSKKRGTYLYGASSSKHRNLMATYAIQWEAIKIAQEFGCEEYDMFGCAPNSSQSHPLHGLYRFKSGFGGNLYHRMGCWDYPLMKDEYISYTAQEIKNQSYHSN